MVCGSKKLIFIKEQEGSNFLKWNSFSMSYFEIKVQNEQNNKQVFKNAF